MSRRYKPRTRHFKEESGALAVVIWHCLIQIQLLSILNLYQIKQPNHTCTSAKRDLPKLLHGNLQSIWTCTIYKVVFSQAIHGSATDFPCVITFNRKQNTACGFLPSCCSCYFLVLSKVRMSTAVHKKMGATHRDSTLDSAGEWGLMRGWIAWGDCGEQQPSSPLFI